MSTFYRPSRPIDPSELRAVAGLVVLPGDEGYALQLTDHERSGYLHAVGNTKGLVIELHRFGESFEFAARAFDRISTSLGIRIVAEYDQDGYRALEHRTAEELAALPRRKLTRVEF